LRLIAFNKHAKSLMKKPAIVVTGGAGYIGSHIVYSLVNKNYTVAIVDRQPEPFYIRPLVAQAGGTYISSDYADPKAWRMLSDKYEVEAVVHCAAFINVGESVQHPDKYYDNNVIKTLALLSTLNYYGIKKLIFSSSCAVYGIPKTELLHEGHPRQPLSPYGNSKLMIELALRDYEQAYGFTYASLRYFNAAGALPECNLGERHVPECHLIPLLIKAAYERLPFTVYGIDYATPDGTCVRDYVHVLDLADAHLRALEYINQKKRSLTVNLGTGKGYSVSKLIQSVEQIVERKLIIRAAGRRAGDAPVLCADGQRARTELGWQPKHSSLETMISTATRFYNLFL
jgi:UDP-glucose 4-epimerase